MTRRFVIHAPDGRRLSIYAESREAAWDMLERHDMQTDGELWEMQEKPLDDEPVMLVDGRVTS
jgi:hypothetical protein